MLNLATVTCESFAPELNEVFLLVEAGRTYELRLLDVRPAGSPQPGQERAPFALEFGGKAGLRIPQRIYRLENVRLGAMEIFLSQLSDGPGGSRFEAVFN